MNKTYKAETRPTDYKFGDGHIKFGSINPSANWSSHMWFNEVQLLLDGQDTDDCVPFSVQESFDMQMDLILQTAPASILSQIEALGFMDMGTDSKPHFHSSPRFLGIQTGNKQNGNSTQEVGDVLRQYGTIPYTDLPPTVDTAVEYYAPATPEQLVKGAQFLALLGGKNAVQYHSLSQGSPKNLTQIAQALQQAPLQAGVAVATDWNQAVPSPDPAEGTPPQHCTTIYNISGLMLPFEDHYVPFLKTFDAGYPINYVTQIVVNPIIAPPLPTPLPPNPTPVQESNWLTSVSNWLQSVINQLKGRNLSSNQMDSFNFSFLQSGTFWSSVVTVLSIIFTALSTQYPTIVLFGTVVSVLSLISANYFHKAAVLAAAQSSATLGKVVSGQM